MLQWSHNKSVVETLVEFSGTWPRWGFNGATTNQLWKPLSQEPQHCPQTLASMEPQQISCGNQILRSILSTGYRSFNGATTNQLWKLEKSDRLKAKLVEGFNGATTNQLWKQKAYYHISSPSFQASMEPQQISCGNDAVNSPNIYTESKLQWSHNKSVVETL